MRSIRRSLKSWHLVNLASSRGETSARRDRDFATSLTRANRASGEVAKSVTAVDFLRDHAGSQMPAFKLRSSTPRPKSAAPMSKSKIPPVQLIGLHCNDGEKISLAGHFGSEAKIAPHETSIWCRAVRRSKSSVWRHRQSELLNDMSGAVRPLQQVGDLLAAALPFDAF